MYFRYLVSSLKKKPPGISWREFESIATGLSEDLPRYKFNLFVQFKRPEYVFGSLGAERADWQKAYYRYYIKKDQQNTLERLHCLSAKRAAVVYASPALWTKKDLYGAARAKKVISRSNIVSVDKLAGHGRFTYVAPGGKGKAYSEPVNIKSVAIEQIVEEGMRQDAKPFINHIKLAAIQIENAVKNDKSAAELLNLARLALLGDSEVEAASVSSESLWFALATIEAFSYAFNVSLYAMR